MNNPEVLEQLMRDLWRTQPVWSFQWPGTYLGVVLQGQIWAQSLGEQCSLKDIADLAKKVFWELGGRLNLDVRLVNPQGEHIPLGIWEGEVL
jgi:hypothetical protein